MIFAYMMNGPPGKRKRPLVGGVFRRPLVCGDAGLSVADVGAGVKAACRITCQREVA